jgi:hypothetical protein
VVLGDEVRVRYVEVGDEQGGRRRACESVQVQGEVQPEIGAAQRQEQEGCGWGTTLGISQMSSGGGYGRESESEGIEEGLGSGKEDKKPSRDKFWRSRKLRVHG